MWQYHTDIIKEGNIKSDLKALHHDITCVSCRKCLNSLCKYNIDRVPPSHTSDNTSQFFSSDVVIIIKLGQLCTCNAVNAIRPLKSTKVPFLHLLYMGDGWTRREFEFPSDSFVKARTGFHSYSFSSILKKPSLYFAEVFPPYSLPAVGKLVSSIWPNNISPFFT